MQKAYYKKVQDYLKDLVNDTDEIVGFVGSSEGELMTKLQSVTDPDKPYLVFFGYQGELNGQQQRTFGPRTISFSIVYKVTDQNDYATQYKRIDDAEAVGMEVMARIHYDATPEGGIDWLYNTFMKDSCKFNEVVYKNPIGLFGHEFHFDLNFKNPLTPDPAFWKNRNFCS